MGKTIPQHTNTPNKGGNFDKIVKRSQIKLPWK